MCIAQQIEMKVGDKKMLINISSLSFAFFNYALLVTKQQIVH
jgi:hypothetical protein